MAYTLFERIVLNDTNDSGDFEKIPSSFIRAVVGELSRGKLDPTAVAIAYSLTPSQQADWGRFLNLMNAHPDKLYLRVVVEDWLTLSDQRVPFNTYRDEAAFWARLEEEITIAGGTVPS